MKQIHINCDLGEGGDFDKKLMPLISACNIACGGHAGNLESMHHTVDLAMEHGVEIGAHPSYPDKENFGRKSQNIEPKELHRSLEAQILSLKQITEAEGGLLTHVKPHGALYNDAQKDEKIAQIIIDVLMDFDDPPALYAPKNSVIARLALGKLRVVYEAFADRNYMPDGSLVSRKEEGAVITKKEDVLKHLLSMVEDRKIICKNDEKIDCNPQTFCLHSDTPNSVEILQYLNSKLAERNIQISRGS
ncbi:MAG: 5-oxoprolinase subunit PxpA [Salinimicrobium sp.]